MKKKEKREKKLYVAIGTCSLATPGSLAECQTVARGQLSIMPWAGVVCASRTGRFTQRALHDVEIGFHTSVLAEALAYEGQHGL